MSNPTDRAVAPLLGLREQFPEGWERTVIDVALRVLRDRGTDGVQTLETVLRDGGFPERGGDEMPDFLSLRDASDLLTLLQSGEADRLDRSRDVLRRVLAVAEGVAKDLLKLALGGVV